MNISNLFVFSTAGTFNQTNITTTAPDATCSIKTDDMILVICYSFVFVIGVTGNSLVFLVFRPSWKHGTTINLLIMYLAIFDCLASIFSPFVFSYWLLTCNQTWHFGIVGCKILPTLSRIFTDISIGVILIMAIDRCRVILMPLKEKLSRGKIHVAVSVSLFMSVVYEWYYISALYINSDGECVVLRASDPKFSYPLVVLTILRNATFITIFSITTVAIYSKISKSNNARLLRTNSCRRRAQSVRVVKMLVVMAVVFAVSVMPRDILHLAYTISWMAPPKDGIPYT